MEPANPSSPSLEPLAYKPAQAATVLNISRARVFELLRDGKLKSVKHGRTRLISRKAIERFLETEEAA